MKSPLVQSTTSSAKSVAQSIAKQIAQEPVEILKDAGDQVMGVESNKPQVNQTVSTEVPKEDDTSQKEQKDRVFAQRRMQALQNEVNDIRKQDTVKELQAKISIGETVPLEDYHELSMDQKQVLKAQMEAVKVQQAQAKYQASLQEVPAIHSKPSRRFGAGQKHEAEKQQTRVEKPVPPSG